MFLTGARQLHIRGDMQFRLNFNPLSGSGHFDITYLILGQRTYICDRLFLRSTYLL